MEVYLIRHTTPLVPKNVCYGQSDLALASTFEEEWKLISQTLPSRIGRIFTSPLSRCAVLSDKLAAHYHLPVEKDNRLMEMNFGDWEMKKWDDIDQRHLAAWMNDYHKVACPGGESYEDVKNRLKKFISEKLRDDCSYLIVTHGGIIKCFHGIVSDTDGMDLLIGYGQIYHFTGILSA